MESKSPESDALGAFFLLAIRTRLELATPSVTGLYSNQLNYRTSFPLRCANVKWNFNLSRVRAKKSEIFFV